MDLYVVMYIDVSTRAVKLSVRISEKYQKHLRVYSQPIGERKKMKTMAI